MSCFSQRENIPKDYKIRVRYISKDVVSLTNTQASDRLKMIQHEWMKNIYSMIPTIYTPLQTDCQHHKKISKKEYHMQRVILRA